MRSLVFLRIPAHRNTRDLLGSRFYDDNLKEGSGGGIVNPPLFIKKWVRTHNCLEVSNPPLFISFLRVVAEVKKID